MAIIKRLVYTYAEVREHCRLLERSVLSKESRFAQRVLRGLFSFRKRLTSVYLRRVINGYYTHSAKDRDELLSFVVDDASEAMETDENVTTVPLVRLRGAKSHLMPLLPEVDCYLHLLVLLHVLERPDQTKLAVECAEALARKIVGQNRRTLDAIAARAYYYYVRAYEAAGKMGQIRGFLHARLRTATLRNDFEGQAVLINSLLRGYVEDNLYSQADKLVAKTNFPENVSNNEWARYLYYLGRIKAIQLDYSEAHKHLVQSLRKAPQHAAMGFRHTVLKLSVTVELLLGDIPERRVFLQKANRKALAPYLQLTQGILFIIVIALLFS